MKLSELKVYNMSMELAEEVYLIVNLWDNFNKSTLGKQLIRAVDSISANISEGFGRFHFKENKHFLYIARGSLYETSTWIRKASNRNLLKSNEFDHIINELANLLRILNSYIKSIGTIKASASIND